ncbi:MAG TPA: serine/threonine-protein kinase [Actinocrinis sp.]|nr:serine/threonine-protein kinase [Actinocrinis sp.]
MQAEETTADPRLSDSRWRSALAECLALYRAVTGDASETRPLQPTDQLSFGPYTVVGLLGQGGMGRVYTARAADGARVAIKALVAAPAARDAALPRFRRELAAARRIEGELTARVVDADLEADPPWLATEYIQGPTLTTVVGALGPLPPPAVSALAVGVASALTDIHAAGVVHRDLKPSNILLTSDGLRVVDFGIARTADGTTLTGPGWTLGTPAFMAPEQVVGRPVDAPADVFALGSVLVYAATGDPPFGSDEATTVMYRTVHDAPELGGMSGRLRSVVEACLDKDPQARPTPADVIDRTLELLGYVPSRPEPPDGERAATTVMTPVLDPAQRTSAGSAALADDPPRDRTRALSFRKLLSRKTGATEPDSVGTIPGPFSAPPAGDGFGPGPEGSGRGMLPRGRKRALIVGGFAVLFAVSATLAALAANHNGGARQPDGRQLSLGSGTSHAPTASPQTQAGRGAAALPGSFATGPGCAASPWADIVQVLPPADQLVQNVGGGDPRCGGVAAAFRKSGVMAAADSGFVWEFHLNRAATCTLSIYIANTAASSGSALYEVSAGGAITQFRVNQGLAKGQWVQPAAVSGLAVPDGAVRLRLTDAGAFAGDNFHVTASSVRADCK